MLNFKKFLFVLIASLLTSTSYISLANISFMAKGAAHNIKINEQPSWLVIKSINFYNADSDDLVTAGVGFSNLSRYPIIDQFNDINNPSLHELRQAKLNRYIDIKNGEGSFFGFKQKDLTPLFDGKIAGHEIQAYYDNEGEQVSFLLQIPIDFDINKPCIVAVPTSDSDGVYNAKDMQIRGLWGLKHNCAVVYNDKGLGNTLFDIEHQQGYLINGDVTDPSITRDSRLFSPYINQQKEFSETYPHRYAIKQLHSQQNPEEKWGQYVINSIEFAFYQLNDMFSSSREIIIDPQNTLVLVYGATDGGGAALKAGEYDTQGFIDGIVAVNPQIQVINSDAPLFIQHGDKPKQLINSKSLIDYSSYISLYAPCAVIALKDSNIDNHIPFSDKFFFAENRCDALSKNGLLVSSTTKEQAKEALDKLYQYGFSPDMTAQLPYYAFNQSVNRPYKYISAYGKYSVDENLCNYSVASIDQEILFNQGEVKPLVNPTFRQLWAYDHGELPISVGGINVVDLVSNSDPRGPRQNMFASSAGSKAIDYNLSGAMCLRDSINQVRVQSGLIQSLPTGQLNQIKTFIVHGQLNVANIPDYSSRAYVALNSYREGSLSQLRYIEVENASDLAGVPPYDHILLSTDYYGEAAMDWLWSNLTKNTTLPDSQVIKTKLRGGKSGMAPKVTKDNLVPIAQRANRENLIYTAEGTLILPY